MTWKKETFKTTTTTALESIRSKQRRELMLSEVACGPKSDEACKDIYDCHRANGAGRKAMDCTEASDNHILHAHRIIVRHDGTGMEPPVAIIVLSQIRTSLVRVRNKQTQARSLPEWPRLSLSYPFLLPNRILAHINNRVSAVAATNAAAFFGDCTVLALDFLQPQCW